MKIRAILIAAILGGGGAAFAQQPVMRQYTVATLPAASLAGNNAVAVVRDGASALDCTTGGGNMAVTCVSNGTTWSAESVGGAATSTMIINNASSTGTTANKLAKLTGAPSTAVLAATSDTSGILGVAIANAGTSGSVTLQTYGLVNVVFDGATTAGDYVSISSTTAGDAHDAGAGYPTSGQVLGRVVSTNATGGTYAMMLYPTEVHGFGTGTAVKLLASTTITPSSIPDGTCAAQSSTITITGAAVGDPVPVGLSPSPTTGVVPRGDVTAANTVTVTLCNFTGTPQTPASSTATATIIH